MKFVIFFYDCRGDPHPCWWSLQYSAFALSREVTLPLSQNGCPEYDTKRIWWWGSRSFQAHSEVFENYLDWYTWNPITIQTNDY